MDNLTSLIKTEIEKQYGNLMEFSKKVGIPYSTLANALEKGVGGTGYRTVVKICDQLGIARVSDENILFINREFSSIVDKMCALDSAGIHALTTVLNVEHQRCTGKEDPATSDYGSIAFAQQQL